MFVRQINYRRAVAHAAHGHKVLHIPIYVCPVKALVVLDVLYVKP